MINSINLSNNEPLIFNKIRNIMKSKTPVIVARALNNHLKEKSNRDIIKFFRNDLNFQYGIHQVMFNPNFKLNTCNCIYCKSLKEYVGLKLHKHKIKKSFFNDLYVYGGKYDNYNEFLSAIKIIDSNIKYLKGVKDNLKSKLGL